MTRRRKIALLLVKLGIGVCLTILILLTVGTPGGLAYFSPYTLEYNTQAEQTIFWGQVPVFRTFCHKTNNDLLTFIQEEGFVTPVQPQKQRWELVFHWNDAWKDGHGSLYSVLVRDRRRIIEWSQADRERARIYWTEGFKLLRSDRKADQAAGRGILVSGWFCQSIPDLQRQIDEIKGDIKEPGK